MRPVSRSPVNKHRSARQFQRNTRTVAAANMQMGPMRGGWRGFKIQFVGEVHAEKYGVVVRSSCKFAVFAT